MIMDVINRNIGDVDPVFGVSRFRGVKRRSESFPRRHRRKTGARAALSGTTSKPIQVCRDAPVGIGSANTAGYPIG